MNGQEAKPLAGYTRSNVMEQSFEINGMLNVSPHAPRYIDHIPEQVTIEQNLRKTGLSPPFLMVSPDALL